MYGLANVRIDVNVTLPMSPNAPLLNIGYDAVFTPAPSCLSDVILVIYIQSLEMLKHLNIYREMYEPFVRNIEFYVDGTWCDPYSEKVGFPCYGDKLDNSTVPDEVNIVDGNGGGWMMQRSLIHAVTVSRVYDDHAGFLFITDDVLLNIGQLTNGINESGCGVIWRSENMCEDIREDITHHIHNVFRNYNHEALDFFKRSDEKFRNQLSENMGSPSKYCIGTQNDFIYIPKSMSMDWSRVSRQMTESGLGFTFSFYTAILGIARMEDMVVLKSTYLNKGSRSSDILQGSNLDFEKNCWEGNVDDVSALLSMHIIHPNKLSNPISMKFARTLTSSSATGSFWCV